MCVLLKETKIYEQTICDRLYGNRRYLGLIHTHPQYLDIAHGEEQEQGEGAQVESLL